MKRALVGAAVLLALSSTSGLARDSLPWKDANPLEGSKAQPRERRAQARKPAEPAKPAPPPTAAEPAPPTVAADVPLPEARPAQSSSAPEPGDLAPPVAADDVAKPETRPADAAETEAQPTSSGPADASADPAAAADLPVTDIPVPDERPKPKSKEVAPAPSGNQAVSEPLQPKPASPDADGPKPDAAAAPAPPVLEPALPKPEEAPNSTEKLKSREPAVTPAASVEAAAAVEDAVACETELKKRGAEFTVDDTISEGECGVLRPVALKRLSSGVEVSPKTQMLCRTALALDDWMTASVVPAAKAEISGDRLTEFRHASTYVCRPRASESGISEHARGSAIDIGSFVFASGREIGIAAKDAGSPDAKFLDTVRAGACGPFKTVLGPGTDADHTTHFHLDIAARTHAATYCK